MQNKTNFNKWVNYIVPLIINNNIFLTNIIISDALNIFQNEVVNKIVCVNPYHLLILFRVQYADGTYATIGKLTRLNIHENSQQEYYEILIPLLSILAEGYKNREITKVIISYGLRKGLTNSNVPATASIIAKPVIKTDVLQQTYLLPSTFDVSKYGKIIFKTINHYVIGLEKGLIAIVETKYSENERINMVKITKKGTVLLEYSDTEVNNYTFIREINSTKYTFVNELLVFKSTKKPVRFINPLKEAKAISNKIINLDIETRLINNVHTPYSISIYDGNQFYSFYLTDFKSVNDMLSKALETIFVKKYNHYHIYVHNFANFYAIFLFDVLTNFGTMKPTIHNGRLITIKINYKNYVFHFKDSFQLLPESLRKLGISFSVETQKSIFPYEFVNNNNMDLNYEGVVPAFNLFTDITVDEYNKYCEAFLNNNWSLRVETIKYCEIDCETLYQVLTEFNGLIFSNFNANINKSATLPALSFGSYRTNYLIENTIPQLSGQIYKDIQLSYTGGSLDVYIPENSVNEKV